MDIQVDKFENYSVVIINDQKVDSTIAPELKTAFTNLKQDGVKHLIINMESVKYMDSSGLSTLLAGNRMFGENGCFVLYHLSAHVSKLISISQLDKVLTILPTKEEAVDFVFMSEIEDGLKEE